MKFFLYNSLTKKKELFQPQDPREVTMYTCGPTVYSYVHIGNLSSFLMADVLRRVLELLGYKVKHVKNITDVGHLLSDSDDGDDKMNVAAQREGKTPADIARFYTEAYIADEKMLNMLEPYARPKATDYINQMLDMVKKMVSDGYAYETSDGIYMDISKVQNYGILSGNTINQLEAGARVDVNTEKRHPADFAVWKKADSNHLQQWGSPWGPSFPGWHLECSAMAWENFNDTYDIKTGGEDNIFPHHECEIAQTQAVYGKPLAHYFVHKRHIQLDGNKMSKSDGNVFTLQDLVRKGFQPEAIRLAFISSHYRNRLNFSENLIRDSQHTIDKVNRFIQNMYAIDRHGNACFSDEIHVFQNDFLAALCDDLNMSLALSIVHECIKWAHNHKDSLTGEDAKFILEFLTDVNTIFAVFTFEKQLEQSIPEDIQELFKLRQKARQQKNYDKADTLRQTIYDRGYAIIDTESESYLESRINV